MGVVSDEVAVRRLFDEMTAGQPDPPLDRNGRIRRRVLRHRVAQAVGTAAVIAAAGAIAISVGTSAGGLTPPAANRRVPAWALPWPDHRNGSVPQKVLDGAVVAWRHFAAVASGTSQGAESKSMVIWYVGQTVASRQVVAVMFEAHSSAGTRLIAGWATASEVMHGQRAWTRGSSPWVLYDVTAPRPASDLFIGLNVHGTSVTQDRNPDNWIVVLAAPEVTGVGWTVAGPSTTKRTSQGVTSSGSAKGGMTSAATGLAVWDAGQITSQVQVTDLDVGNRNILANPRDVGVPGSAASQTPQLAAPGRIPAGTGFVSLLGFAGQGAISSELTGISGRLAVRARCYGPGPLRIQFGQGSAHGLLGLSPGAARGRLRTLGTIACDDGVHELITSVRLASRHNHGIVIVDSSPDTAYRVDVGTASKP